MGDEDAFVIRVDGDANLRHVAVYDGGHVDIELSTGEAIAQL